MAGPPKAPSSKLATSAVTATGGKVQHSAWAWCEWYPASEIAFSNFQVQPGDTVEALVRSFSPTTGYAGITNVGANTATSVNLSAPTPSAVLAGQNAEWILEDDSAADYGGAIFFYDCNAGTQKSEVNLTGAMLIGTAIELSPTVLEII